MKMSKKNNGKDRSIDKTVQALVVKAGSDDVSLCWDRLDSQDPQCGYGTLGLCCRHCYMGPCQINPYGDPPQNGVCGANAETIAARHLLRGIAAGAAAHSDHGRGVVEAFVATAKKELDGFDIKDEQKLYQLAMDLDVAIDGKDKYEIAQEIGKLLEGEFGRQSGTLLLAKRAPLARQKVWEEQGVTPRGVDREIVECMHRTHIGVDQDYLNLMKHASRTALGDGWGGSMIATELQDIMFGSPVPILGPVNLGILEQDQVNVIVHGHEPILSEMIVAASRDPELMKLAKEKGAAGINIGGICCTANEMLMRHGIPVAGNFLQQEIAIVTGAVDAMIVDVQCIWQSLVSVADCYHTELITTNPKAKFEGARHIEFDEHNPVVSARNIIKIAIENFPNRKKDIAIPKDDRTDMVVGFSHETINYLLGGVFRGSYKPLNDNIINGRIRGVAGVVGCNNAKVTHDDAHVAMVKELIKNDVIVLQTGCSAIACAKEGLLLPEAAQKYAGAGLAEVCETVGIPPVLHMGSCVDNSRILMAAAAVVKEGGLGDDISDLPAAGAAPEWMSEKALSIGHYFVASGVYTVFGVTWPTLGAKKLTEYLFEGIEEELGGKWAFEPDPIEAAKLMIAHIDSKRKALGIDKARERVLFDMEKRRELEL
jgi:carbon-monoxide dehydrogenase catalytic subunit